MRTLHTAVTMDANPRGTPSATGVLLRAGFLGLHGAFRSGVMLSPHCAQLVSNVHWRLTAFSLFTVYPPRNNPRTLAARCHWVPARLATWALHSPPLH
eukprot:245221-Lingulodinium_polyedra.AAC.1